MDSELFIVVRGRVTVMVQHHKRSKAVEVAQLGAGQFFGEMSLMTGEKRKATVRSVGETELMAVGKEAFHRVFDLEPELMQRLSVELAEREKQLDKVAHSDRLSEVDTANERSAELLKRIRDFFSL
jgi:branched-chain amino acid transport system substrate-binding protein